MSATARAAWLDAWEGPSTPSPFGYREGGDGPDGWGYARQPVRRPARRVAAQSRGQAVWDQPRPHWSERTPQSGVDIGATTDWSDRGDCFGAAGSLDFTDDIDLTGSVVRMSAARAHKGGRFGKGVVKRQAGKRGGNDTRCRNMHIPEVPAIEHYDWDAAARRRPGTHEYERVILHADRTAEARMTATHYYTKGATARVSDPWADSQRRPEVPRLRVVEHRVPRWRLGLVAVLFGLLVVGLTIVTPMMMSSSVASLEAAVGQAEAEQEQLAADTAALAAQISSLSSPQRVAEEAEQLGLIPANQVSYVPSDTPSLAAEGDTTVAGR